MLNFHKILKELKQYGDVDIRIICSSNISVDHNSVTNGYAILGSVKADNGKTCGPIKVTQHIYDEKETNASIELAIKYVAFQLVYNLTGRIPLTSDFE